MQETNFNILTRGYRTAVRLQFFFPRLLIILKMPGRPGITFSYFLVLPQAKSILERGVPHCPKVYGVSNSGRPSFFPASCLQCYWESIQKIHLFDAAKACIPLKWKSLQPLTIGLGLRKVEEINKVEALVLSARNQQERNYKTWALWNMFICSDKGRTLFGCDPVD